MNDDKQQRIMRSALSLFAHQGFYNTTTAQIALRAEIGTGTLFRYFASKEALIHALYEGVIRGLEWAPMRARPDLYAFWDSDRQELRHLWMSTAQFALTYPDAFTYWILCRSAAHSHYLPPKLDPGLPFDDVARCVDRAAREAGHGELARATFIGQWEATVSYVRQPTLMGTESALLERCFDAWWRGLGLK